MRGARDLYLFPPPFIMLISSALAPVSTSMRVWGTLILGEVVPVLILRSGKKASAPLAPKTCISSKGGWRSGIASSQCVACLKDNYPKECRFSHVEYWIGPSMERVVVVLDYAVNAARCQENIDSEPSSSVIRH